MNLKPRDANGFMVDEARVITISVKDMTQIKMAEELEMNFNTFEGHLKIIYDMLRIHTINALAAYAIRMGYAV